VVIGNLEYDGDAAWTRTFVGACERARPLGAASAGVSRCAIDIALSRSRCDGKPVGECLFIDAAAPFVVATGGRPGRTAYCSTRRNARFRRRGGVDHRGPRGYAPARTAGRGVTARAGIRRGGTIAGRAGEARAEDVPRKERMAGIPRQCRRTAAAARSRTRAGRGARCTALASRSAEPDATATRSGHIQSDRKAAFRAACARGGDTGREP
jgi:hypothetical protein